MGIMGWRDWLFHKKTNPIEALPSKKAGSTVGEEGKPFECTPTFLGQILLAWVVTNLESTRDAIKIIAKQNSHQQGQNATEAELEELVSRLFSSDKETELFRQLCLFYDALWCKILLPELITKTGRVQSASLETYRKAVRQKSMEVIATSEHLPKEWRNWGSDAYSTDMKADFEFYMHGVVTPARQDEFDLILNFLRVRDSGPVLEMLAWLHMRTREILGLVDKKELFTHAVLWKFQGNLTGELIEMARAKIVPIPE